MLMGRRPANVVLQRLQPATLSLTIGGFLLTVELLCLQLFLRSFVATDGGSVLAYNGEACLRTSMHREQTSANSKQEVSRFADPTPLRSWLPVSNITSFLPSSVS